MRTTNASQEPCPFSPSGVIGARRVEVLPRFVPPQLATLVDVPPRGSAWLHEIKLDGYRTLARLDAGRATMYSRTDKDWTSRYRPLANEIERLPVSSAMLDGEVVVPLPSGATSFQLLQNDVGAGRTERLVYFVFDLLFLNGFDLTASPIEERKGLLEQLLAFSAEGRLRFSDHFEGDGEAFYERACALKLEGIVSKKAGSRYRPGYRGPEWVKIKCLQRQEFVVGGYTDPTGSRYGFGALLLGQYERGRLRYVGKVGTGFNERSLRELTQRLSGLSTDRAPFEIDLQRVPKRSHWVTPELVAEVAFTEWTRDGDIRHPSFKGLREDKPAAEVVPERAAKPAARRPKAEERALGIRLTNAERIYWPAVGVTKRELVKYYEAVSEWMMPHVLGRPVSMLRCPQGVAGVSSDLREDQGGPCFFHKHAGPEFPGPFQRVEIVESEGPEVYLTITEPASLAALAQMGVLEIHIWGSRWPDVEHPDTMVFDLDPDPAVGWPGILEAARLLRTLLDLLGLQSFVKTTGGKGLHVVVPIKPSENWDGVKEFTRAVADAVVTYAPSKYTSTYAKARRGGKTFVDYLRNARTATSVSPFSTRAKERPTVSVPVRWDELGRGLRPDSYTIQSVLRRLKRLESDPWEGYFELQKTQSMTDEMKSQLGLK